VLQVVPQLQFEDLPLAEGRIRLGEQFDGLLPQWSGHFGRPGEQEVAAEDGHSVVPVGVDRDDPPAALGFVDHVVVIEAADMHQFDCHSGLDRPVAVAGSQFGSHLGQQRPVPLASGPQQVLGDLGEELVLGGGDLEKALLHLFQARPDPIYRDEISDDGMVHGASWRNGRDGSGHPFPSRDEDLVVCSESAEGNGGMP